MNENVGILFLLFFVFQDGLLSALPYLVSFLFQQLIAYIFDYIRRRKWLSTTAVRRLAGCMGKCIGLEK